MQFIEEKPGPFSFTITKDNEIVEVLRIDPDGRFFVENRYVETDSEVFIAMRNWLVAAGFYRYKDAPDDPTKTLPAESAGRDTESLQERN